MPRRCIVGGCSKSKQRNPGITLHAIPKDPKLKELWVQVLKTTSSDLTESFFAAYAPSQQDSLVVCSDHFRHPDDFVQAFYLKQDFGMPAVKRLKPNVVPSIFPGHESTKKSLQGSNLQLKAEHETHKITKSDVNEEQQKEHSQVQSTLLNRPSLGSWKKWAIKRRSDLAEKSSVDGNSPAEDNSEFSAGNISMKSKTTSRKGRRGLGKFSFPLEKKLMLDSDAGASVRESSLKTVAVEDTLKTDQNPVFQTQVSNNRNDQRSIPSKAEEHRLMPSVAASVESPLRTKLLTTTAEVPTFPEQNTQSHYYAITKILSEPANGSIRYHPILPKTNTCPDCATSRMFEALHSYLLRKARRKLAAEGLSPAELPEPMCAQHRSPGDDSNSASLNCEHNHSGNIAELIQKYKNALNVIDLLNVSLEREQNRSNELALQVNHLSSVIQYMLNRESSLPNTLSGYVAATDGTHSGETNSENNNSEEPEDIKPNMEDIDIKPKTKPEESDKRGVTARLDPDKAKAMSSHNKKADAEYSETDSDIKPDIESLEALLNEAMSPVYRAEDLILVAKKNSRTNRKVSGQCESQNVDKG